MSRKGFSIVEAAVALMLLSVGASALGVMLLRASRAAAAASSTVQATAVINSEVSRLSALPFDSLTAGTSCVTASTAPHPHTRCTTVANISTRVHEVTVIVTPAGNSLMRPDTVRFRRSRSVGNGALNTP